MAIQMRRGLRKDFDPNKMLPGEWAVSIDSVTSNQIVWMCFAAGICKRMGTYEDFQAQIAEATKDIRDSYVEDFNEIKADIELIADVVSSDKEEVIIIKSDIINTYLPQMQEYAERAEASVLSAETSASNAENSATLSKSYAVGGTGRRENENSDNSKYYYEQTKQISQGINGIVPMGTVTFANLPTENIVKNAMYNISDAFVSDERFNDGGGVSYGAGNNVIWTAEGKWDVTASSSVTGIKGEAEDTYRQGNVTITAENIGLGTVKQDIADLDADVEDLQGQIDAVNSNLLEKISWAIADRNGAEMFFGTGTLNIEGQQTVNDNGHYAGLIIQETGWTKIDVIIPIMNANIPVVITVQSNIIYAYSVNASGTYDNVPFSYVAIGR